MGTSPTAPAGPGVVRAAPIRVARIGPVGRVKAKGSLPSAPPPTAGRASVVPAKVPGASYARVGVAAARTGV